MSEHTNEPLPGLELLLAKGLGEIGDDDEFEGQAALADSGAAHAEAAGCSGEDLLHRHHRRSVETGFELQFFGSLSQESFRRSGKETLAGAIHETEPLVLVEREDGDVDLAHYGAEEHRSFHGAEALFAK